MIRLIVPILILLSSCSQSDKANLSTAISATNLIDAMNEVEHKNTSYAKEESKK